MIVLYDLYQGTVHFWVGIWTWLAALQPLTTDHCPLFCCLPSANRRLDELFPHGTWVHPQLPLLGKIGSVFRCLGPLKALLVDNLCILVILSCSWWECVLLILCPTLLKLLLSFLCRICRWDERALLLAQVSCLDISDRQLLWGWWYRKLKCLHLHDLSAEDVRVKVLGGASHDGDVAVLESGKKLWSIEVIRYDEKLCLRSSSKRTEVW